MSQITNPEVVAWVEIIRQQLLTIPYSLKTSLQIEGGTEQDLQKTIEAADKILRASSIKQELYKEIDRLALNSKNINVVYRELIKDNLETLIHHLFFTIIPSWSGPETLLTTAIQDLEGSVLAAIKAEKLCEEPQAPDAKRDFEDKKTAQPYEAKTNSTPSNNEKLETRLIHSAFSTLTISIGNKYRGMISAEVGDKIQNAFRFLSDHPKSKESIAEYTGLVGEIPHYYPNRQTLIFKFFNEKMAELFLKTFPKLIETGEFAPYVDDFTDGIFEFEFSEAGKIYKEQAAQFQQAVLNSPTLDFI